MLFLDRPEIERAQQNPPVFPALHNRITGKTMTRMIGWDVVRYVLLCVFSICIERSRIFLFQMLNSLLLGHVLILISCVSETHFIVTRN